MFIREYANITKKKVKQSCPEILEVTSDLTGNSVKSCYKFGINTEDGTIYYKNSDGEWAKVPGGEESGGGSTPSLQDVTDIGATTTNSITSTQGFVAMSDSSVSKSVGILNTTDGFGITLNEGGTVSTPTLLYGLGGTNTMRLQADNITSPRTLQLPNASGTLAQSITDGTTTLNADVNGSVDISSLLSGSSTPALQAVTDVGYIITNPIVSSVGFFATGDSESEFSITAGTGSDFVRLTYTDGAPRIDFAITGQSSTSIFADNANGAALQLPSTSGSLAEGITDGITTIHAGTDGIINISSLSVVVKTSDNYADDSAAATGGISVGGLYHTDGVVKIRLS